MGSTVRYYSRECELWASGVVGTWHATMDSREPDDMYVTLERLQGGAVCQQQVSLLTTAYLWSDSSWPPSAGVWTLHWCPISLDDFERTALTDKTGAVPCGVNTVEGSRLEFESTS